MNARITKLSQRETSTADYVRKLESRLDEQEAQAAGADLVETETIVELRSENQRLRDNEQSSEAYLAVLEENLAEADADIEFWKREVDRLEKVVERQRGLRKLDTLLDELDEVQKEALERAKSEIAEPTARNEVEEVAKDVKTEVHPSVPTTNDQSTPNDDKENKVPVDDGFLRTELSNLRKSHESTVRKLEDLTNTYNSSLECIAELKEQLEEIHQSRVNPYSNRNHRPLRRVSLIRNQRSAVFRERGSENLKDSSYSGSTTSSGTTALILALALFGAFLGWGLRILQERFNKWIGYTS